MEIRLITLEELEAQGIDPEPFKRDLKLESLDHLFIRLQDFPKKFRQQALNLCQELCQSGCQIFLIETQWYITVWQKKKKPHLNLEEKLLERSTRKHGSSFSAIDTAKQTQDYPESKRGGKTRVYRGNAYEISSLLNSSEGEQSKKIKKIYRGQECIEP